MKQTALDFPSSQKPKAITVLSGYEVNLDEDRWVLDKDITINLSFINELHLDNATHDFIRLTLADRVQKYMAGTIKGECIAIKDYLRRFNSFNSSSFFEWTSNAKSAQYPTILKSFVIYGYQLGIHGVDKGFIEDLKEYSLSSSRKMTLIPVEDNDVIDGPFSDLELENIMARSLKHYTKGTISLEQYAALMFFAQTGRRGIQASDIKIKDIQEPESNNGIPIYYINVPRRKQRGQKFRETFNKTVIDQDLWLVLQLQIEQVKQCVLDKIKDVDFNNLNKLALFPSSKLYKITNKKILMDKIDGDFLHAQSAHLSRLITSTSQVLDIISERTGELLNITPKRFRHTIGTNSAREGYGARVIAEILDHTTDVVAGVYTKNTPDIVERLDRALAVQLAPLAQAFSGVIVRGETEAKRCGDPASRVSNGKSNLGSCGSYGFCSASAPVACYTCQQFQPWLHAPHEDVLNHLLEQRERINNVTGDNRIASVNNRLILAVTEVIQRCEEQKIFDRERENV